ncbi:hypothetical protein Ancab_031041 [Ancistrocladus abbreviatus]
MVRFMILPGLWEPGSDIWLPLVWPVTEQNLMAGFSCNLGTKTRADRVRHPLPLLLHPLSEPVSAKKVELADSSGRNNDDDLEEILKPFYQRASEAEHWLSRLEADLSKKRDAGGEESSKLVRDLQAKLEVVATNLASERGKVAKLSTENEKKDYHIIHLLRALREADSKLDKMKVK